MNSAWMRAQDRRRSLAAVASTICLYALAFGGAWLIGSLVPSTLASVPSTVIVDLGGRDGPPGLVPLGLENAPDRTPDSPLGAAPLPAASPAAAPAAAPAKSAAKSIPVAPAASPKAAAKAGTKAAAKASAKAATKAPVKTAAAAAKDSGQAKAAAAAKTIADKAAADQAAADQAATAQAAAAQAAAQSAAAQAATAQAAAQGAAERAAAAQAAAVQTAQAAAKEADRVAARVAAIQAAKEEADAEALAAERSAQPKTKTFGSGKPAAASGAPVVTTGGTGSAPGVAGGTGTVTFRGAEMGNALATTFGASAGQVGRYLYVPIYLYMPLPQRIDDAIFRNIAAKEAFKKYYQQSGSEWRLKTQVPVAQRDNIWDLLERAGFDASTADFKTDRRLTPVTLDFAVGPLYKNRVELVDLRLVTSSGSSEIDEAVMYGFRQATFFNKTGNAVAGRFNYGF